MSKQKKIVTTKEDKEVLNRARNRIKIGEVVNYQGKNLRKIKGGWEEIRDNTFTSLIIIQV